MAAVDLQQIIDGEIEQGESVEYDGFFLINTSGEDYIVQLDGHIGKVSEFAADEFDNALELVDELNRYVRLREEYVHYAEDEALIDWAGKMMTSNEELAEEKPDRFIKVPDHPPEWDAGTEDNPHTQEDLDGEDR